MEGEGRGRKKRSLVKPRDKKERESLSYLSTGAVSFFFLRLSPLNGWKSTKQTKWKMEEKLRKGEAYDYHVNTDTY